MCGIVGFWGEYPVQLVERMSRAVAHRGPDDCGIHFDAKAGIGLGHRRLSILDVSPAGRQPMWDRDERVAVVYNGEIYNYRELRKGLEQDGYSFRSDSDTEVLLTLYLAEGADMLPRLNGIFAFAIWDSTRRQLFIARDGQGIKPLYYTYGPHGFLFASELKALLCEASVDRSLDPIALAQYVTYLYCPSPRTPLAAVKKLEPGTAMLLTDRSLARTWKFYELPYGQVKSPSESQSAIVAVRQAVRTAVQRQMVADVPVGAFLSGGLDSSAVVAFAREFSQGRLQCFTIDSQSRGRGDGFADDLPYARKVARHLDVDLAVVTVGPEMADRVEEMVYHLDEPQADPAPINVLFIARLARQNGIKVLLSGAGGDDIFTGYRRHLAVSNERYWSWLPRPARAGIRALTQTLPGHYPTTRRLQKMFAYADLHEDERVASYFWWVDPKVARNLLVEDLRAKTDPGTITESFHPKLQHKASPLEQMLFLDGKFFLTDHNLNYTDKMSMAAGVEARVPLLDKDLIELVARLPDRMKQNGGTGKWIFKKAMEPYLPAEIIYRPKTGFGAPLRQWIKHELRSLIHDVLSPECLKRRGIFDPAAVCDLIDRNERGERDAAYPIFALLCIEIWCRLFLDRAILHESAGPIAASSQIPSSTPQQVSV